MPLIKKEGMTRDASHLPDEYPFKCNSCTCSVASQSEAELHQSAHALLKADKSKPGKAAFAKKVKQHCESHDNWMEFEASIFPELPPKDNIVDWLHSIDLNLGARIAKYSWMDPVLHKESSELREIQSAVLLSIGCPLDLREDGDRNKKWFHGAVWHYDFVLGVSKESLGLDGNTLLLLLVTFGAEPTADEMSAAAAEEEEDQLVDDLDDDVPAAPEVDTSRHTKLLTSLFGHNADKVRSIMKCTDAYAEVFNAVIDEWTGAPLDTEYNEQRASRLARSATAPSTPASTTCRTVATTRATCRCSTSPRSRWLSAATSGRIRHALLRGAARVTRSTCARSSAGASAPSRRCTARCAISRRACTPSRRRATTRRPPSS
jgi:hypothetical protein